MREQPWNVRRPSTHHYSWYRNLVDLHALTMAWLKELNVERPAHFLRRTAGEQIAEILWMVEPLAEVGPDPGKSLDQQLDDTSPDDLLGRLEHTVHMVQAWTLSAILDKTPPEELAAVRNQLEQSSWKAGRAYAQLRWPDLDDETRRDLRGALAVYRGCALAGRPEDPSWLAQRAVPSELHLRLLSCPHNNRFPETRVSADALCELYAHWTRGFAYAINTRITIDYVRGKDAGVPGTQCSLQWRLNP